MQTTVALCKRSRLVTKPSDSYPEKIVIQIVELGGFGEWLPTASVLMTQDQCGALIFGLERAAEAARIAQDRAA